MSLNHEWNYRDQKNDFQTRLFIGAYIVFNPLMPGGNKNVTLT